MGYLARQLDLHDHTRNILVRLQVLCWCPNHQSVFYEDSHVISRIQLPYKIRRRQTDGSSNHLQKPKTFKNWKIVSINVYVLCSKWVTLRGSLICEITTPCKNLFCQALICVLVSEQPISVLRGFLCDLCVNPAASQDKTVVDRWFIQSPAKYFWKKSALFQTVSKDNFSDGSV